MKVASKGLVYITVPLVVNIVLAAVFSLFFRHVDALDRLSLQSKNLRDSNAQMQRHLHISEGAKVIAQETGNRYFQQLRTTEQVAAQALSQQLKLGDGASNRETLRTTEQSLEQIGALQLQVQLLGVSATAGNVFLSAILAIILYRSIVGRLMRLTEECSRYKPGQALPSPLSGKDEIASIEQEFRSMVSSIEAATKRERDTLNNIADLVGAIAPDGRFTHCNKYATSVCGINAGTAIQDVVDENEAARFFEFLHSCRTEAATEIVLRIKTVSGNAPFRIKGTLAKNGQELYVVARDIREELMRDESKRQVLSTIGHDMKAPLQSIRLALASIGDGIYGRISAGGVQLLERADIVIHSVLTSLSELLDFERMEQGKLTLLFAPCELIDILYDAYECAGVSAQHNLESTGSCTVNADAVRLANAFNSLILAASSFAAKVPTLQVSLADDSRAQIVICFDTDNPIERLDALFEQYSNKAPTTSSRLSLPLSRAIIRAHGGSITTVQHTDGEVEFSISLPLFQNEDTRHSNVTTEEYSPNYEPQTEANAMNITIARNPEATLAKIGTSVFQKSSSEKVLSIVGWWESRRPVYNLAVGLSGLPSVVLYIAHGHPNFLVMAVGILIWGFAANCGYTLGAITEIVGRKLGIQMKPEFAPGLFALGLLFSCGLTIAESMITVVTKIL